MNPYNNPNCNPTDKIFTAKDLIDAFEKGRQANPDTDKIKKVLKAKEFYFRGMLDAMNECSEVLVDADQPEKAKFLKTGMKLIKKKMEDEIGIKLTVDVNTCPCCYSTDMRLGESEVVCGECNFPQVI